MADSKSYDAMMGRAITDASFRSRLLADPRGTVKAEGYEVGDDVIRKLESVDAEAAEAAVAELQTNLGAAKAAF